MHIPDGFLHNAVSGPLLGAASVFAGLSVAKLRSQLVKKKLIARRKLALANGTTEASVDTKWELTDKGKDKLFAMATVGAFIFAAQMMNFNVASGTSGHFVGAALATIALGRYAGIIIMMIVLGIQALMFGDGGIVAFGANVVNMAVIGSFMTYLVFDKWFGMPKAGDKKFYVAAICAGWLSVMAAALAASIQLILSGNGGIDILTSMLGVHALIGIGEGIITALILTIFFRKIMR